jgi:hypothetical protein
MMQAWADWNDELARKAAERGDGVELAPTPKKRRGVKAKA